MGGTEVIAGCQVSSACKGEKSVHVRRTLAYRQAPTCWQLEEDGRLLVSWTISKLKVDDIMAHEDYFITHFPSKNKVNWYLPVDSISKTFLDILLSRTFSRDLEWSCNLHVWHQHKCRAYQASAFQAASTCSPFSEPYSTGPFTLSCSSQSETELSDPRIHNSPTPSPSRKFVVTWITHPQDSFTTFPVVSVFSFQSGVWLNN